MIDGRDAYDFQGNTTFASLLHDPARQHQPDAILVIAGKGLMLPGAGGKVGEPGEAAAAYASTSPFLIWCVVEERDHPQQMESAERAFARAFEIAAARECAALGVIAQEGKSPLTTEEAARVAMQVLRRGVENARPGALYFFPPGAQ